MAEKPTTYGEICRYVARSFSRIEQEITKKHELLRPGGKMIMTLADATRDFGFETLFEHVRINFKHQGRQTTKFEWLCPEMVENILGRLGFVVEEVAAPSSRREYCFVAVKT